MKSDLEETVVADMVHRGWLWNKESIRIRPCRWRMKIGHSDQCVSHECG